MKTVSIVVPCYNAAATVEETIESALAQDVDLELIAVDDGSQDETAEILKGFGSRIRTHLGPNRGVSAARNTGLELSKGRWVQFLDSDDLLYPRTLEQRLAAAGDQHDMVVCDWEDFDDDDGRRKLGSRSLNWPLVLSQAELAFATTQWAPPAAILYRRDLVDRIGGFSADLPVIQDARFMFDAAHRGAKIAHADHIGAGYRIVEGSLSRRNPVRFWRDVLVNGRQIESLWRARGDLGPEQRHTLADIFHQASRGLFLEEDPQALVAAAECRRLGGRSLHVRVAPVLARLVGLPKARRLLAKVGKA